MLRPTAMLVAIAASLAAASSSLPSSTVPPQPSASAPVSGTSPPAPNVSEPPSGCAVISSMIKSCSASNIYFHAENPARCFCFPDRAYTTVVDEYARNCAKYGQTAGNPDYLSYTSYTSFCADYPPDRPTACQTADAAALRCKDAVAGFFTQPPDVQADCLCKTDGKFADGLDENNEWCADYFYDIDAEFYPDYAPYTTMCSSYSSAHPEAFESAVPDLPRACQDADATVGRCAAALLGFTTQPFDIQARCLCYDNGKFSDTFDGLNYECANFMRNVFTLNYESYETYTTICHAYSTGSPDFVTELAPPPSVCTEVQSTQESCSYGTPGFETLAPEVQAECLCYSDGTFSEDFDAEDLECASYVSTAIPALYDRYAPYTTICHQNAPDITPGPDGGTDGGNDNGGDKDGDGDGDKDGDGDGDKDGGGDSDKDGDGGGDTDGGDHSDVGGGHTGPYGNSSTPGHGGHTVTDGGGHTITDGGGPPTTTTPLSAKSKTTTTSSSTAVAVNGANAGRPLGFAAWLAMMLPFAL